MEKRFFKQLFMLCLFGMISIGASAEEIPNDEIWYTSSNGKVVTPNNSDVFGASIVSNTYTNNKGIIKFNGNVTKIGTYAFQACSGLTSVTIPNSVTEIGSYAFRSCSKLKSVTIPNSVTEIGGRAFYFCTGLTSVTIPNSVTSIGEVAFEGCSSLTSVTIPNSVTSIGRGAFWNCDNVKELIYAEGTKTVLQTGLESITSVTIPNSVTSIGDNAFRDCSGLTSVTIPNSVTEIGSYAFSGCSGLTSVTIPNSVTSIGDDAFEGCDNVKELIYAEGTKTVLQTYLTSITSVTIPNSVTSIGSGAFSGCSNLTSVVIPNSVSSLGDYAFIDCSGLKSVTIGNSVTEMGENVFSGCTSLPIIDNIRYADTYLVETTNKTLSTYKIQEGTKWIGSNAFKECKLTSIDIPNFVTSIGGFAFDNCSGLTSIEIPNSVTSIGRYAFYGCSGLTSIEIPNSVTMIGEAAFSSCSGLTSVTIPNSVTEIRMWAFSDCSGLTSVKIPNSVTSIGGRAFDNCSGLTSVTIGESVTSIGNYAFSFCTGLTSVTIGESVTSIGNYAFEYCSGLTSVNITDLDKWAEIEFGSSDANPLYYAHNLYLNGQLVTEAKLTSAKKIGDYAFLRCSSLTSVTIPNSVTSIGGRAFDNCSGLTSVNITDLDKWAEIEFGESYANPLYYAHNLYLNENLVTKAELNTAKKISSSAFEYCSSLTSVTIGNSVTSIGDYAFYSCSKLINIIAEGINAPTIGTYCFNYVNNCTLHVPLGSEEAYASNFGTYFKSGNSYGNTIVPYSTYSKNSAGEYSFEVWDASSDVELSEGADKVYVPVEATVNDLQYKRTFNNTDWQALYVPFELDVVNDLADFSVYEISTSSADAINVTLMTEGKTLANTPYLIKAKATGEQAISVSSKTVKVTVENTNSELSDFEIVGTYAKLNYGDISGDWYALKGGKFMKAGEGAYLNPYRFYLKRKASSAKESIDININEPTGITLYENENDNDNENENLYNLNGMRVDSNYKGIVIINGKKYLKK